MSHDQNNTRILPAHAWWGVNRKADPCRFSPSLLHKQLLSWGNGLNVVLLLQLLLCMPKSSPAAKIITDRCLTPFPQPTVTVCTQTTVYSATCSTWQLWHATVGTMSASTQKVSLVQPRSHLTCRGAEALTKGPVLEWVWPQLVPFTAQTG